MIEITRWPALILANYRTGSSPLTYKLAEVNSAKPFVEPSITSERLTAFNDYRKQSDHYLVKFMPDQLDDFPFYKELLESSCYKIKISRKDKVQQITSHYIATVRNKWWTTEQEQEQNYYIPIISDVIDNSIDHILRVDRLLDSYNIFDNELFYEDLGYLDNVDRKPAHKPANVNALYNLIKARL